MQTADTAEPDLDLGLRARVRPFLGGGVVNYANDVIAGL